MAGLRVEPDELADRARRLRATASELRAVATGSVDGGRGLVGGLDEALSRFDEQWRSGHGRLAERVEDLAERLARAAQVYVEVDREVARGAGA